jgi:hypothetical protein
MYAHTRLKLPLHKTIICQIIVNGLLSIFQSTMFKYKLAMQKKFFCLTYSKRPRLLAYQFFRLITSLMYTKRTFVNFYPCIKAQSIKLKIYIFIPITRLRIVSARFYPYIWA